MTNFNSVRQNRMPKEQVSCCAMASDLLLAGRAGKVRRALFGEVDGKPGPVARTVSGTILDMSRLGEPKNSQCTEVTRARDLHFHAESVAGA